MKPRLPGTVALMIGTMVLGPVSARARPAQTQAHGSFAALIQELLPTVVNVTSLVAVRRAPDGSTGSRGVNIATYAETKVVGSGFIISPAGLIITNYHVVQGAYKILVTLSDGTLLVAKLSQASPLIDIALLKVDAGRSLPAAHWGDSSALQVGDRVFAIGNPFGVGITVTRGIVSALNRSLRQSPFDDFIQTDAPINHGNSGGPLFDSSGAVVGIDSDLISPTAGSAGLGFAIASDMAKVVVDRLEEYGWVRPSYLGVTVEQITPEMADALWIKRPHGPPKAAPRGSIVSYVDPVSPAAAAGVKVGDIIQALNGHAPRDTRALLRDLAVMSPGAKATLTVDRQGKQLELTATIAVFPREQYNLSQAIPPAKDPIHIPAGLGIKVTPRSDGAGVVVSAIAADTDAAARGIVAGDVILRIQDHPVASEAQVLAALKEVRSQGHDYAMFLVRSKASLRAGPDFGPKWVALQIQQ